MLQRFSARFWVEKKGSCFRGAQDRYPVRSLHPLSMFRSLSPNLDNKYQLEYHGCSFYSGFGETATFHLMLQIPCTYRGCSSIFKSRRGRTYHIRTVHDNSNARPIAEPGEGAGHANGAGRVPRCQRIEHPHLTGTPHIIIELLFLYADHWQLK